MDAVGEFQECCQCGGALGNVEGLLPWCLACRELSKLFTTDRDRDLSNRHILEELAVSRSKGGPNVG